MADEFDPLEDLFSDVTAEAPQVEAPVAEAAPEVPAAEEAPAATDGKGDEAPEPKMVPIEALHESRRRAQDAEARLEARGADTRTAAEEPAPRQFRDIKDDPEGFAQDVLEAQQLNAVNTTLNFSERLARKEHGEELVKTVREWAMARFDKEPEFAARILLDPDPYERAIAEYNEAQVVETARKLPPEVLQGLDAEELALLQAHRAAKAGTAAPAATEAPAAQPTPSRGPDGQFKPRSPAAPKSIIDSPASGKSSRESAVGAGVAFDSAFG